MISLSDQRYQLHTMDALALLQWLPTASVDLIVTDPAYESLEKHRKIGTTTRLDNWFDIFPNDRFGDLFREAYRVLRPNRHFYMLCDQETMFVVKPIAEAAGFTFWKPLIWDKMSIGMGYHYRARYEVILFFEKGKRKLADLGIPDILEVPRVRNGYPTEKPVELLEILVKQSSSPGELVLDPFMGSGSTGVAALHHRRIFIGCDLRSESISMAKKRLETVDISE